MIKKRSILSWLLAFCLCFAMAVPAFANEGPELLQSEETVIAGQNVTINTYNDNGYIVETFNWPETTRSAVNQLSETEIDTFLDARYGVGIQTYIDDLYSGPISFNERGQSASNAYCAVRSVGDFYATCLTPRFYTKVQGGYFRGNYGGPTTATKIVLSETYTFSGVGIAVSWPPSFSAVGSSYTWTSSDYANTNLATANRPEVKGSTLTSPCKLAIQSRADIYLGNVSYPATVSMSCNTRDFLD